MGLKPAPTLIKPALDEVFLTDYCIATNAIYIGFAWSIAAEAYSSVISTAMATGVGFFDVSANDGGTIHDRVKLATLDIL